MKKWGLSGIFLVSLLLVGCTPNKSSRAEDNPTSNEQKNITETSKVNDTKKLNPNKMGVSAKVINSKSQETYSKRKYVATDEYDDLLSNTSFKTEVFQDFPIEFALFTKNNESSPSAILVYSSTTLANSTVTADYNTLVEIIENLISDDSKKNVVENEQTIDGQPYTTFIFNNELSEEEILKPFTETMHSQKEEIEKRHQESMEKIRKESKEKSNNPPEHTNALIKAEQYIKSSNFSKEKLYAQLIFEKYPQESARYAVENIEVDWNEQALMQAKKYQESQSMALGDLRNQLTSSNGEGFTSEEAEYAIQHIDD